MIRALIFDFNGVLADDDPIHMEAFRQVVREEGLSFSDEEYRAIEDSIGGIQSAHEAGMRCLAIAHSYGPDRLRTANPEWIINSIADFVPWLEEEVSK